MDPKTDPLAGYLRQALDQGMEGFAILDAELRFLYVNPAHASMYGYRTQEFIGSSWRQLYQPNIARFIENECLPQLQLTGYWRGQVLGLRKDQSTFPVELVLTQLTNTDGEFHGLSCNCRDITERQLARDSLSRLQKVDALGHLTGGVAHDFKNLLSVIMGNIDLSLNQELPQEAQQQLHQAYAAGQRGAALVSRLLAFVQARRAVPQRVNIEQFMGTMDLLLRRTVEESVTLSWHAEPDLWECRVDASQLESAVLNLVLNARDASPQGGHVEVHAYNAVSSEQQPVVHLTVADNGDGAAPEVVQQMFDPFFSTKDSSDNSGLGLYMVKAFAVQAGGEVSVRSEPGNGTKVQLTLPALTNYDTPPVVEDAAQASRRIANGQQILLVEDDAQVRETTTRMLSYLGFSVTTAADGQQALDHLTKKSATALVLSDIRLPGKLQGTDVAEFIYTQQPHLGCLLMTGYAPSVDASSPAADVNRLTKPFTINELAAALKPLLTAPA